MNMANNSLSAEKLRKMEEEMSRFEAEIANTATGNHGANRSQPSSNPSMFMPPQLRRNVPISTMPHTPHPSENTSVPSKAVYSAAPQINISAIQNNAKLNSVSSTVIKQPIPQNIYTPPPVSSHHMADMETEAPPVTHSKAAAAEPTTGGNKSKTKKFIRCAGGETWEDASLADWDPNDFRMFCGDLGNEVSDEVLTRVFNRYTSFQKAKIIRDKRTGKSKGYGFVSFSDPTDFTRAMREMNGKYVGNRPIKLKRSDWRNRQIDVVRKKKKEKRRFGLKL